MTNWEKEKAYCERRADKLRETILEAIEHGRDNEFKELFTASGRYLKRKEQAQIMRKYVKSRRV